MSNLGRDLLLNALDKRLSRVRREPRPVVVVRLQSTTSTFGLGPSHGRIVYYSHRHIESPGTQPLFLFAVNAGWSPLFVERLSWVSEGSTTVWSPSRADWPTTR